MRRKAATCLIISLNHKHLSTLHVDFNCTTVGMRNHKGHRNTFTTLAIQSVVQISKLSKALYSTGNLMLSFINQSIIFFLSLVNIDMFDHSASLAPKSNGNKNTLKIYTRWIKCCELKSKSWEQCTKHKHNWMRYTHYTPEQMF